MTSVHDVAAYVLRARGPMSTMKLQKLVYYSQAWSLALRRRPMFREAIQAWAYGPVVYELFEQHRGRFVVDQWPIGDEARLPSDDTELIDRVLSAYGRFPGVDLSKKTHAEAPWKDARAGLPHDSRCNREITHSAMLEFYSRQPIPFCPL